MIAISGLTESDKGKWVRIEIIPGRKWGYGKIKQWNDRFIFVVFNCDNDWKNYADYTAEAVNPSLLEFVSTKKEKEE